MSGVTKQDEQQSQHSLLPLTLPSTNNPVDCLYERKGGRRPDEGLKRRAKDAQSQCPPLETLPNKNNPVDCFCERKPKSPISRRGSERSELLTPHQGRLACTTTLETAKEVRSTIFHDKTHYRATEPASCKSLVPQCLSNLAPSFAPSVRKFASPLVP